jgi:hypothetical protein
MFRLSMLSIFSLYNENLSISYSNVCGEFIGCGKEVGVRARLCRRREHGLGLFRDRVKITSMSTYSYV